MAVRPETLRVVNYPDPVLRAATETVDSDDPLVREVAARMVELMHESDGVGLAAPQVGLSWRMFVTNARETDPVDRIYMNPVLDLSGPEGGRNPLEPGEEGCLSLPGISGIVNRPAMARIRAVGLDGPFELEADGFLARVWQHEFDHLEGILIIDRMGPKDRLANRRRLRDLEHV